MKKDSLQVSAVLTATERGQMTFSLFYTPHIELGIRNERTARQMKSGLPALVKEGQQKSTVALI